MPVLTCSYLDQFMTRCLFTLHMQQRDADGVTKRSTNSLRTLQRYLVPDSRYHGIHHSLHFSTKDIMSNTANGDDFDDHVQSILDLMSHRVNGTASVTNDQIEHAVQNILRQQPQPTQPQPNSSVSSHAAELPPLPTDSRKTSESEKHQNTILHSVNSTTGGTGRTTRSSTMRESQPQTRIVPDLGDYDDLPDNDHETSSMSQKVSATTTATTDTNSTNFQRTDEVNDADPTAENEEIDWSIYETIPLGKQGAQMMTIFGDGKYPLEATVRATLIATRRKVQCTIQDARHVRRQQTELYRTAKNSIKAEKSHKPGKFKQDWSTELLFRANAGYDPLAYQPRCGFGKDDLQKLHPEELNAYQKWDEMHSAAAEATTTPNGTVDDNSGEDPAEEKLGDDHHSETMNDTAVTVGHLEERAAHFDLRTNKMGSDWYMKYANIRQRGSFLPRHSGGRGSSDAMWDATTRQKRKTGEHATNGGGWTHMAASAVRFLHWVGFDPMSPALPPPTDDVTAALAFLAYDFFGRIVEKAIFLRNCQRQVDAGMEINEVAISNYELGPGEQLTEQDIQRAMDDPDIKPVPLYSVESKTRSLGPQLYFGPGFEDRLEMEMDEMLWDMNHAKKVNDKLSKEELLIRQQEDELFAQLAKPPTQDGIVALLQASHGTTNVSDLLVPANPTPTLTNASKRAKR